MALPAARDASDGGRLSRRERGMGFLGGGVAARARLRDTHPAPPRRGAGRIQRGPPAGDRRWLKRVDVHDLVLGPGDIRGRHIDFKAREG